MEKHKSHNSNGECLVGGRRTVAANRNPKLGKEKKKENSEKSVEMFVQWTNKLIQIVDYYVTESNAEFPGTNILNRVVGEYYYGNGETMCNGK